MPRPCHCEEAKPTRQSCGTATALTRTMGLLRCARNDKNRCHCVEAKPTRQSCGVATAVTRTMGLLRCARNDKGMLARTKIHVIARGRSRRGNLVVLRRRSQGRWDCFAAFARTKIPVIARRRSRRGNLVVLRRRSQGRRDRVAALARTMGLLRCARNDKKSVSLRGGEADAAILWCCDGVRKDDGIASLRLQGRRDCFAALAMTKGCSQGQKSMSLRGGEADAAILWCCDGGRKDDGIASLRSQ